MPNSTVFFFMFNSTQILLRVLHLSNLILLFCPMLRCSCQFANEPGKNKNELGAIQQLRHRKNAIFDAPPLSSLVPFFVPPQVFFLDTYLVFMIPMEITKIYRYLFFDLRILMIPRWKTLDTCTLDTYWVFVQNLHKLQIPSTQHL